MYILNVYQLDNICVFYIVYISPLCLNPFSLTSLFSQQFNAESKINAVTHQKRIQGPAFKDQKTALKSARNGCMDAFFENIDEGRGK